MAEEDDAGAGFFFGGEDAVAVGVEQAKNVVEGLFAAPVLENADVGVMRNDGPNALGELNRAVMRVVMVYEPPNEADENVCGR